MHASAAFDSVSAQDAATSPDLGTKHPPRFTAGLADGLGDRVLTFDDSTSVSLELLRVKREFSEHPAFEAALKDRVELLSRVHHPSLGSARAVERRGAGDGLTLVSKHTAGRRLSDIIHDARGAAFAQELIGQLAPALATLQQAAPGVAHGVLTPERVVVTREGRLVIVEHVLGSALAAMNWPAARLQRDLGLAVANPNGPAPLDARSDVVQLGMIALSLLLGRRLEAAAYPSATGGWLAEFASSDPSAFGRLRPWLERALQLGDQPFVNAVAARDGFTNLLGTGLATTGVARLSNAAPVQVAPAAAALAGPLAAPRAAAAPVAPSAPPAPPVAFSVASTVAAHKAPVELEDLTGVETPFEVGDAPVNRGWDDVATYDDVEETFDAGPPVASARAPEAAARAAADVRVQAPARPASPPVPVSVTPPLPVSVTPTVPVAVATMPKADVRPAAAIPAPVVTPAPAAAPISVAAVAPATAPTASVAAAPATPAPSSSLFAPPTVTAAVARPVAPSPVPAAEAPSRSVAAAHVVAMPMTASAETRDTPGAFDKVESADTAITREEPERHEPKARSMNWAAVLFAAVSLGEAVVIAGLLYSRPSSAAEGMVVRPPAPAEFAQTAGLGPTLAANAPAATAPNAPAPALVPTLTAAVAETARLADANQADKAASPAARGGFGGIRVSSPIELQVFENGTLLGSTAGPIAVTEGTHALELVSESLGFRFRQTIDVKPGQMAALQVAVPNGRISINAVPWASVTIDGTPAGDTPLANLALPIGTHEIVFRHPQFGEQRQTVVVKAEGLTRVSASLQR